MYAFSGIAGIVFLYYFHKAQYSFHRTEVLLLERFRQLPLYYPPGPSVAEENSSIDPAGLPHVLVELLAEWFLATDQQQTEGVTRDDVLELFVEFGVSDQEKPCKEFLHRGEGTLEERRRLSGTGLQESISLLARLAESRPEGPNLGFVVEAASVLRRKLASVPEIGPAAAALQQALQPPATLAGGLAPPPVAVDQLATSAPTAVSAAAPLPTVHAVHVQGGGSSALEEAEEDAMDEAEQSRLEAARLARAEDSLLALLERQGSLSPAEEARLLDVREQRAAALRVGLGHRS